MRAATWLVLCGAAFAQGPEAVVKIEIDTGRAAAQRVPRTIYGTFLEPIGNSTYGGLWAQLLANPSFEENLWSTRNLERLTRENPALHRASQLGLPVPWEPLEASQGARYEPRWQDAANSFRSILLMARPDRESGIRQEVYLPVHRVLEYQGSVFLKRVAGPDRVEVSLRRRNAPQFVLARAAITPEGEGWKKYSFQFTLQPRQLARLEPADFVIAAAGGTRILIDQATLSPADAVDGLDPDMVTLSREMKTPVVRFGGNYTSAYHWRDGVGDPDRRVSMLNLAWGMPEYNSFGTDEYLAYCRRIGAEPQICLNLGTGTPEEAAEWMKYVNQRWNNGRGGLLWELGNELWGDFQTGYPTRDGIASLTARFALAAKGADAKARLIATGADPDGYQAWNAEQLKLPKGAYEYLSTHFVVGNAEVLRANATLDHIALASFAEPVELERRLRAMKQQMEEARSEAKIAFTEWLFHGQEDRSPMFLNMGGAVCTGGFLNMLLRVSDIVPISDMTGIIEFGGIYKKKSQVFGTPAYWAFRMYSTSTASRVVATRVSGEMYQVTQGNRRLPEIKDVPYLDVVAALNEESDRLWIFAVNRHLTRDLEASFALGGFSAAGEARVRTLAAPHIYTQNDELRPTAVVPKETVVAVKPMGFDYTFPRSSMTVIELRRAAEEPALKPVADKAGLPRVLLIGDSISMGYTLPVRELLESKANVHRIPENGGPTTRGMEKLDEWLGTSKWDVIHFNFGLHDLKIMDDGRQQVPVEKYEENLRKIAARLKQTGARLIWATTTPVPEGKLNPPRRPGDVKVYNDAALRVMKESGVEVDDLNGVAMARLAEIQRPENVHFTDAGSKVLAEKVAATIVARR